MMFAFVGPGVEELIHSAAIAMAGQVPIGRLGTPSPCFPSISEVWLRLLEAYRGRQGGSNERPG